MAGFTGMTSGRRNDGAVLRRWRSLVKKRAQADALIEAGTGKVYRFGELEALAEARAEFVSSFPRLEGNRVAFAAQNGAGWLAIYLALLKVGSVPVPLDAGEPVARQRELARAARARLLWIGEIPEEISRPVRESPGLCVIKLTSGSTGAPRALPFRDEEMLADSRQICATMGISSSDRNLAVIPFGHSYGLGNLVFPLLDQGTPIVCASAPLPHALASDVARWCPTVFPAVPALLRILAMADLPKETFTPLRTIISAGSALEPGIAQQFYEKYRKVIHGFYGSSETGGICYDRTGEATLAGRSVGIPLRGVHLRFGQSQRFWVESAAVMTRRHRTPGRVRPPDRGQLSAGGELQLLGRAGRIAKIAGRRVDLSELEQALRRISGVRDAWVHAESGAKDTLSAAVATDLDARAIRLALRDAVASWKIPRRILTLVELPVTRRGKLNTVRLRALLAAK